MKIGSFHFSFNMTGISLNCTSLALFIIAIGSVGNWISLRVFTRKSFRSSVLTPFFMALLIADSFYLIFRVLKLFYYQQFFFESLFVNFSCAQSSIIQFYGNFTQRAPQIFVPLCHYEFYIRFSLLLICFLAIQRAYDMHRSCKQLVSRKSSSKFWTYALIALAFVLSYFFELFGLSIFCSSELSPITAYGWYEHLRNNLSNETIHLISFMKIQAANQSEIDCIDGNSSSCSQDEMLRITRKFKKITF